ncbi:cation:proton antiporter [Aliiglaciecola sp. CAU 1673]|uniref:cation:proton antiporter n=1 Tax=Aliiglaciecola sp. CAU 1673 TaxID=3032595 RepID=UPI0023DC01A3|nr:cation:proton antiporter [Aliiglaciecola sp. CAU 1673]MDF2179807.1 cation:proton antiporter [Aliiglaciecola sp. CAU 1673]
MDKQASWLLLVGGFFLITLLISPLASRFHIPRASLFILSGILLSQATGERLNGQATEWFNSISSVTLLIIGYLLGTKLTLSYLRRYAKSVTLITLSVTFGTFALVALGLYVLGMPLPLALIFGVLASATDPAATYDVIRQTGVNNRFTRILEGVVALDDAAGLILFSLVIAALAWFGSDTFISPMVDMLWEIGGALVLGCLMGLLLVFLLNLKQERDNVFVESLGLILLCGGLALYLHVSFLLSAMVMGLVVVNRAKESQEHLHDIEFIEQPMLILFFILAGASASLSQLWLVGDILLAYVLMRIVGRVISALLVPQSELPNSQKPWLGLSLLPQAGVAMGMALLAAQYYPEYQDQLVSVTVAATIIFELLGPLLTFQGIGRSR